MFDCTQCHCYFPTPSKVHVMHSQSLNAHCRPQLHRHMTVHTRAREHQCDMCGAAYSQREGMVLHQRRVHGRVKQCSLKPGIDSS